jgi:hypothetical protein
MDVFKIPVAQKASSHLKAVLLNGQETVWSRDEKELAGKPKRRGISEPI